MNTYQLTNPSFKAEEKLPFGRGNSPENEKPLFDWKLTVNQLLADCLTLRASDLHLAVGLPPVCRIDGALTELSRPPLLPEDTHAIVQALLTKEQMALLQTCGDVDLSLAYGDLFRCRLNVFVEKEQFSLAIRIFNPIIPHFKVLGLPDVLINLSRLRKGLVLITGPAGSGKTTTLASMVDWINTNRKCHIITLEEPVEYVHRHKSSIIHQREIGRDAKSYASAIKAALRQDPDVILIGEMRDAESISAALTAAETGHLVLSTLHTLGAAKTIDRIIDNYPSSGQNQIRSQLAAVLQGIVSQQLIPKAKENGRAAAVEVMIPNFAIRNLIRENKIHQIENVVQTGGKQSMRLMDISLSELVKQGIINHEEACRRATDPESLMRMLALENLSTR